jgi:hypothetical protein
MDISVAIMLVANRFQYKKDTSVLIDSWSVMRDRNGVFYGDCEDFSLTVFWYMSNQSILKFIWNVLISHRYQLVWCKTKTDELHFYGKVNGLCFDNWTKKALPEKAFLEQTGHKKICRMFMPICIPQIIKGLYKR